MQPKSESSPDRRNNPGRLAGLVSPEAERLYERLVISGSLPIGSGDGDIDMHSAAAVELAEAGLLFGDPNHADCIQAISNEVALQLLLSRHQQEILAAHDKVMQGWSALDALLRANRDLSGGGDGGTSGLIEIVTERSTLNMLSASMYVSARLEMCATSTGHFTAPLGEHQLITPPKASLANGTRFRNIYDSKFAASPAGAKIIEQSRLAGEEARMRETLPTKMLLVDHRIALIALTDTGIGGAVLVRSPQLLNLLHQWFDLIWDDPSTTKLDPESDPALTPSQLHVLRLLAGGMTDDAIAQSAGMSVRTVRRHITTVMDILGVSTRFAAGVAATKRGWI